jgi:hypothetical protein
MRYIKQENLDQNVGITISYETERNKQVSASISSVLIACLLMKNHRKFMVISDRIQFKLKVKPLKKMLEHEIKNERCF